MMPEDAVDVAHKVVSLRRLELTYAPHPWAFARERRAAIDAHFEDVRRERPGIWNGQILLMHRHRVEGDRLEGAFLATDYASFLAWRDWGWPDTGVTNCFAMGALRGSDGGWLLGVMAQHTSAPGKIYFPSGAPDLGDVTDGKVDLAANVTREMIEETGLTPADFVAETAWYGVLAGPRIALMKVLQAHAPANDLRRRIRAHLAREKISELADVRIVRGRSDLDPMMPSFMTAFLAFTWS